MPKPIKKKEKKSHFTSNDKATLESIKPIVDGIAALLGENCEVLLHSLENLDKSVIHIANGGITGRSIGSPITDLGMRVLKEASGKGSDVVGSYYTKTADGRTMRSVTVLIRNAERRPIGLLCINLNLDVPLLEVLKTLAAPKEQLDTSENFATNIEELIQSTLHETIMDVNNQKSIPNLSKNKVIVGILEEKGIFSIRGAVDIVARKLSVSRYTIYNYIREHKQQKKRTTHDRTQKNPRAPDKINVHGKL